MIKSNKIRQLLALFIVVASLSLAVVIVLKVYREKATAELLRKLPQNIDVALRKIHFTETRDGIKKWDLVADQAEYDKGREVTHLTGVRLVVAGGRATGDITLTAGRADYYNTSRDVRLAGKVMAKSVSGMEFSTESATYIAARSVITTSSRVKFADGTLTVEGVGMELMPATKNIRVFNEVIAHIMPEAGR
jgi:LPS export ABC transporter protein LptC